MWRETEGQERSDQAVIETDIQASKHIHIQSCIQTYIYVGKYTATRQAIIQAVRQQTCIHIDNRQTKDIY